MLENMNNLELEELSVQEMKEKNGGELFLAMGIIGAIGALYMGYQMYVKK
jgi:hypothetical protein